MKNKSIMIALALGLGLVSSSASGVVGANAVVAAQQNKPVPRVKSDVRVDPQTGRTVSTRFTATKPIAIGAGMVIIAVKDLVTGNTCYVSNNTYYYDFTPTMACVPDRPSSP